MRYQNLIIITKVTVKLRKSLERIPSPPYHALRTTASGLDDLYRGILMAARPTRILSYSRTIVFRKRTKVKRENAHLHARATWRARNVTCADLNAVAYFEESLLDHETWELSHPLPYWTRLSTNKLTFIIHTSRFMRKHYTRAPIVHYSYLWNVK